MLLLLFLIMSCLEIFYVDKLGFEIIRENHRPERHDYKLDLRCGDIELEIFGNKTSDPNYVKPPKRPSYPEACGLRHLAFRVTNIEEVVKSLEERVFPANLFARTLLPVKR